jgi:hypothetical protein
MEGGRVEVMVVYLRDEDLYLRYKIPTTPSRARVCGFMWVCLYVVHIY